MSLDETLEWLTVGSGPNTCSPSANRSAFKSGQPRSLGLTPLKSVYAGRNFLKQFKLIWAVQSFAQKYSSFVFPEIGVCYAPSRLDCRGAYRDRHDTRGGLRWTRMCRSTNGIFCGRRSRVVLARPCRRQVGDGAQRIVVDDGGNKLVHRGEYEVSRKPLRREGRCDHRLYLVVNALAQILLRGGPGCSGHPVFPAPSVLLRRVTAMHNSGERRRENAFACLETVIPGRCEASNPESRDSGFAPSR